MKLISEYADTPVLCPVCNQQREKDEYCLTILSENKIGCVIQKKVDWPQFVDVPRQTGEPVMQNLLFGYTLNTWLHKIRTNKKRFIKIKRFNKSFRYRVNVSALSYGRILNDHWVDNWRE